MWLPDNNMIFSLRTGPWLRPSPKSCCLQSLPAAKQEFPTRLLCRKFRCLYTKLSFASAKQVYIALALDHSIYRAWCLWVRLRGTAQFSYFFLLTYIPLGSKNVHQSSLLWFLCSNKINYFGQRTTQECYAFHVTTSGEAILTRGSISKGW